MTTDEIDLLLRLEKKARAMGAYSVVDNDEKYQRDHEAMCDVLDLLTAYRKIRETLDKP